MYNCFLQSQNSYVLIPSFDNMKFFNASSLVNFIWFQSLWFIGVLAPAVWGNIVAVIAFVAYLMLIKNELTNEHYLLILLAMIMGTALDSVWILLGIISFTEGGLIAPLWITVLWAGLTISFSYSLAWLQHKPLLVALLGFLCCPISYYSAAHLGALQIVVPPIQFMATVALVWSLFLPILVSLSALIDRRFKESHYG